MTMFMVRVRLFRSYMDTINTMGTDIVAQSYLRTAMAPSNLESKHSTTQLEYIDSNSNLRKEHLAA